MKKKAPVSIKKQNVTLKDLKIKKDPKGGFKLTTLPSIKVTYPTVSCIDPHL